jgi:uncharacterized protein (UPF0147 family)
MLNIGQVAVLLDFIPPDRTVPRDVRLLIFMSYRYNLLKFKRF